MQFISVFDEERHSISSSVLLHELNTIIFTLAEVIGRFVVCVMVCKAPTCC